MRPLRLAAAAAAASLPLWPTAAGAAEGPEQQWQKTEEVVVYGDTCQIYASLEYEADFARAELLLFVEGEGNCDTVQTHINADLRNLEGDQQRVSSGGAEYVTLFAYETSRIERASFSITFTNEECQPRDTSCYRDYSVSPK